MLEVILITQGKKKINSEFSSVWGGEISNASKIV